MRKILFLFLTIWAFQRVAGTGNSENDAQLLHRLNQSLSVGIIYDGFSPPVASRIYAYCNITAYEAVSLSATQKHSLIDSLNGFARLNIDSLKFPLDNRLVLVEAFGLVTKDLVYRIHYVDSTVKILEAELKPTIDPIVFQNSLEAAKVLHKTIQQRIKSDNYKRTRTMPKFTPSDADSAWKPTYPTFADGLEPYWGTIKPFVLDSSSQFSAACIPFSTDKKSAFYQQAFSVYEVVNKISTSEKEFADFWDCNPQKTSYYRHLMIKTRQLTPGGHWMAITRIACIKAGTDLTNSARIYALVGIAISDAFINCWEEKYRTNSIRPETYIQHYIDSSWQPILETPSFPEFPSGHSEVSAAACVILTNFFGANFAYADSSETTFNRKVRTYKSFEEACNEAAMSRYYGGIHYKQACDEGQVLGKKIGEAVLRRLRILNLK